MSAAKRAIEEHEADLFDQLMARVQQGIAAGATVGEAVEEMERATIEDPEARQLVERLLVMMRFGGGACLPPDAPTTHPDADPDVDVKYRLRGGPGQPLVKEELELIGRLTDAVDERLPADIAGAERRALAVELLREDPELAAVVARLEKLSKSHSGAVLWGLAWLGEKEAEEADSTDP
jgi:hypothetical protein